jgi:hypothetical protein
MVEPEAHDAAARGEAIACGIARDRYRQLKSGYAFVAEIVIKVFAFHRKSFRQSIFGAAASGPCGLGDVVEAGRPKFTTEALRTMLPP